jgi:erythromycin esterase
LWDYVAANANAERPLELAGFDSQISGSASRKYLVKELGAFLNEVGINTDFLNHGTPFRARLEDLMGFKYWRGTQIPSITEQDAYFRQLDQLEKEINEKGSDKNDPRTNSWLRRLQMLRTYPKFIWMPRGGNEAMRWQLSAEREKQGADNMLWLANERYRGKKIIVWGATFHLLRNKGQDCANPQTISLRNLCKYNYVTMGQRVWESLGHQVYVLGFTAYGGSRGLMTDGKTDEDAKEWSGPLKQDQDPTIELEELFNAAGFNYAFLDLRSADKHGEWLKTPIRSRPLGNEAELRDWTQALDGMFFIREQQPNTRKTPT